MREYTSSKLSAPIMYEGFDFEGQLKEAMNYFYDNFLKKDVKPKYDGRDIIFSMNKSSGIFSLSYPERFLHIVSLGDDEKFNMFPCINDPSYENCENRCDSDSELSNFSVLGRNECQYRLSRIHWIKEVVLLANKHDKNITEWEVTERDNQNKKYQKRLIRYHCGIDDYLVIFKKRKEDFMFISAYPVVTKRKKKECDHDYQKYQEELARQEEIKNQEEINNQEEIKRPGIE